MITENQFQKIKLGTYIETKELTTQIVLAITKSLSDTKTVVLTFDLTTCSFKWSNKSDIKAQCNIIENKNINKIINGSTPMLEIANLFILRSVDLFLNNTQVYENICNSTNVKLLKEFADLIEDKEDYEKIVVDTRTDKKYNLIEKKCYEGEEYIKLLRRNFICKDLKEVESLCVHVNEFNKFFKPERTDLEKDLNNLERSYSESDVETEVLIHDEDIEFDIVNKQIEKDEIEEKLRVPEKYIDINEFLNKQVPKTFTLPSSVTINSDNIISLDFELYEIFTLSDSIENTINDKFLEDKLDKLEHANYVSFEEFMDWNDNEGDFRLFVNEFKPGDKYFLVSPFFDYIEIIKDNKDTVDIILNNVVRVEDWDYPCIYKNELTLQKDTLSLSLAFLTNEKNMKKNRTALINLYQDIRKKNIESSDYVCNLVNEEIVKLSEIDEQELDSLIIRKSSKFHDSMIYDYRISPVNEMDDEFFYNVYLPHYNVSNQLMESRDKKDKIGKTLFFRGNSYTVCKLNRKYIYLIKNICNEECDTVIRLPRKEFTSNSDLFNHYHLLDLSTIYENK